MFDNYVQNVSEAIKNSDIEGDIMDIVTILRIAINNSASIFLMGNGGSSATSSHLACDLQKGFKIAKNKRSKVFSLTDNTPLITAWANDYDYNAIFAEQIDSLATENDIVIAISASGNSPNIVKGVEKANEIGAFTIGFCGFDGGKLAGIAKTAIVIESNDMQIIEDAHSMIAHYVFKCLLV